MEYSYNFTNIIIAFLILIIGIILGKVFSNIVKKIIIGIESTFSKSKEEQGIERTITTLTKWTTYLITIVLVLTQLGLKFRIIVFITAVILSLITLFVLLTFKDWMPNLVAGLYLRKTKQLKIGRTLIINNIRGKIINFSLLETKIKNTKGEEIYLPNSLLKREKLVLK